MKKCIRCYGSGQYLGNGFVLTDCDCEQIVPESSPIEAKIDKRSKHYKEAISKLMDLQNISKKEAMELFDKTYEES